MGEYKNGDRVRIIGISTGDRYGVIKNADALPKEIQLFDVGETEARMVVRWYKVQLEGSEHTIDVSDERLAPA